MSLKLLRLIKIVANGTYCVPLVHIHKVLISTYKKRCYYGGVLILADNSRDKYDKLLILIRGTAVKNKKSYEDIGKLINRSKQPIVCKFNTPGKITLDELLKIGKGLNIPIEDLRKCIRY